MCGIAGYADLSRASSADRLAAIAEGMAATLAHRGPDGSGHWVDADAGLGLGHRRLSIIDLSEEGRQPMVSPSGRYVLAYNGEAYNFLDLKRALEHRGHRFRGHCDTEILLAAIDHDGLDATLEQVSGMFAFALWDRRERVLHLVRDRMGKKPLYFGRLGGAVLFASELKAFRTVPGLALEIDRRALAAYMRLAYVPAPVSIYRHVFTLPPGSRLALPLDAAQTPEGEALLDGVERYWSASAVAEAGARAPLRCDMDAALDRLDALLRDAVSRRMVSDVPIGAFLSGGIDSSLVVATMQRLADRPVKTFTIGYDNPAFDEAAHAARVAEHLGTDHRILRVTDADARAAALRMPEIYDEPFADPSQIPTFLVSGLAAGSVKVALSGDGGDELFCGYKRYVTAHRIAAAMALVPHIVRRPLSRALQGLDAGRIAHLSALLGRPAKAHKLEKLAALLAAEDADYMYLDWVAHWLPAERIVAGIEPDAGHTFDPALPPDAVRRFWHRMMFRDLIGHLPDDILVKVDRASMAHGLEVRTPILDRRIVAFAWRLPLPLLRHRGAGKHILRRLLARHLPASLFERPKQGFQAPIADWLRGGLRDWAEDLLNPTSLAQQGLLHPAPLRRAWAEHLEGRYDRSRPLWTALMFLAWKRASG